jgi:hypothetical protein
MTNQYTRVKKRCGVKNTETETKISADTESWFNITKIYDNTKHRSVYHKN